MTLVPVLKPRGKWPSRLIKATVAVGGVAFAFAAIEALTGSPSAAYRSLPHPHMRADTASAWAAWATFVIAAIAAVFAYRVVWEGPGHCVGPVVVIPMNVLVNSQLNDLEKFLVRPIARPPLSAVHISKQVKGA